MPPSLKTMHQIYIRVAMSVTISIPLSILFQKTQLIFLFCFLSLFQWYFYKILWSWTLLPFLQLCHWFSMLDHTFCWPSRPVHKARWMVQRETFSLCFHNKGLLNQSGSGSLWCQRPLWCLCYIRGFFPQRDSSPGLETVKAALGVWLQGMSQLCAWWIWPPVTLLQGWSNSCFFIFRFWCWFITIVEGKSHCGQKMCESVPPSGRTKNLEVSIQGLSKSHPSRRN